MSDEQAAANKVLAEALGWTALRLYSVQPNAWWGLPPGVTTAGVYDENVKACPDYYGSVDAVLAELPEDWEVYFEHARPWVSKWEVCFGHMNYSAEIGNGATRAEAAANALLAYAQARHADAAKGETDGIL